MSQKLFKSTEEFDCERRGFNLTKICLGTGAYAKVKLAYVSKEKLENNKRLAEELKDNGTNKVAIKVIKRKNLPKDYVNKFLTREIECLHAAYRLPHVVQLYETFRTERQIYLVMEYASQGDLLEYINSRSTELQNNRPGIGEKKAKSFFKQLLIAVQHCHKRNIVHRDLKCENILIAEASDGKEVIKITDFGFATRFPTNKNVLLETFCGSYAYAAPEILQAEKYDGKIADIWSLGVILFAMINGKLPYNDRNICALIEQTKEKPRFSSRVSVSEECKDLICKILTHSTNKRSTLQDIFQHPWLLPQSNSNKSVMLVSHDGDKDFYVGKLDLKTVKNVRTDLKTLDQNQEVFPQQRACLLEKASKLSNKPSTTLVPSTPTATQKLLHSRGNKNNFLFSLSIKKIIKDPLKTANNPMGIIKIQKPNTTEETLHEFSQPVRLNPKTDIRLESFFLSKKLYCVSPNKRNKHKQNPLSYENSLIKDESISRSELALKIEKPETLRCVSKPKKKLEDKISSVENSNYYDLSSYHFMYGKHVKKLRSTLPISNRLLTTEARETSLTQKELLKLVQCEKVHSI
ncbi:testis-specific serine/threonine-protein kinase 5 isoform X4 [Hydra vulgaris]|uniref:Testis-specific serine/threonine-protein kinase 5 isoform X4 n=1 Tax=Hydra vulgaris TaxID=6087 RepID=A0ABM4CPK0_HYDVU